MKLGITNVKGGPASTVEFALHLTAAVYLVFLFFIFALIIIKYVLQKRSSDFLLTNLVNTRVFLLLFSFVCVCMYRLLRAVTAFAAFIDYSAQLFTLRCCQPLSKCCLCFLFSLAISSFCTSALSYITLSLSLYRADCVARCLPGACVVVVVALSVNVLLVVAVTVKLPPPVATPTLTVLEQRMQM